MKSAATPTEGRILVIDDEAKTVEVILEVLQHGGYSEVRGLTNPHETLEVCREFQPDLVLLDLIMPEMSGYEVLRNLRAAGDGGEPLPVVILTADASQEARRTALGEGATDFIIKPFDATEVLLRSRHLLETRFLHRALLEQNQALTREICERREAEVELRHKHEELTDFFENAPTCLHWVGSDGTILWANDAELQLVGYTAEEYIGHPLSEFHADEQVISDILERLLRRETLLSYPARLLCKDGSIKHVLINSNTLWRDGKFVHTRCFTYDITARMTADEALRDSLEENARLATAIDASPTAVVLSDPNQRDNPLVFVNPAFTNITGYEAEEVLGTNCRFLQGPETSPGTVQRLREAIRERSFFRETMLNYRKDGTPFWNELTVSPVLCAEGRLINYVGLQTDVTEEHRAVEAQRESEERFRQLAENIDAVFWMGSADGATLLYVSPAYEKIWGRSSRELCQDARIWEEALHPEDRERALATVRERRHTGRSEDEYRIVRPDGTVRWIIDRSFAIRDDDGAIVRFAGIAVDITERQEAQDVIDRFFTLSLDKLATAGFDGYFKRLNPRWEQTLGWTRKELTAVPFLDFVHPDDRAATEAELDRLKNGAVTGHFENRYRTRDGSYRSFLWTSRADPDRRLIYATARDITESKQAEAALIAAKEEAERADAAKSEFLSRMSHELRTPLNAILGFGQLLEMSHQSDTTMENVQQILKAGRHLLELINEVLQLSGLEAGRLQLSLEPVPVGKIVQEACALVRPLAATRNIVLEAAGNDGDCHVLADHQRLLQVLLNFLANAVKYNREGGGVTVTSILTAGRCRISVTDNGPGIAANELKNLFVPFERLGADRTGVEGTGLGLSLSKSLTEAQGGTIGVESVAEKGSTFWIELPTAERPPPADGRQPSKAATASASRRARILYIEDNLSNLRLVERLFADRPEVELLSAMQGQLGLDLARQHHPDLILLDLHLPDLDGAEVLGALQARADTAGIPVIMLSADATDRQIDRLRAAGARAYVTKPFEVADLLRTINDILAPS